MKAATSGSGWSPLRTGAKRGTISDPVIVVAYPLIE